MLKLVMIIQRAVLWPSLGILSFFFVLLKIISLICKQTFFRIMCTVEVEINTPRKSNKPGAGSIHFFLEFLPVAYNTVLDSVLDAETEECLTLLETLYRDTSCIDFETLCIEINKYVFDMKCSLKVIYKKF